MFILVFFAVAVAIASADWAEYKVRYNKTYSATEDSIRKSIYQVNARRVTEHNELYEQGKVSYTLGLNNFADMTNREFRHAMLGLRDKKVYKPLLKAGGLQTISDLPKEIDWRTRGYVTPVKNQGDCGSCWAFSATGSLEGANFKSTGTLVSLSESNLVDCSSSEGNDGCDGGNVIQAFDYVIKNKGIDTEEKYPYVPKTNRCAFRKADIGTTLRAYEVITPFSERALQRATAEVGPISVGIDAGQETFQLYTGGVYDEPRCNETELNHAVLVVGYGVQDSKDYWIVKNSWSADWGDKGYILMSRNRNNQCGIATAASYPIV